MNQTYLKIKQIIVNIVSILAQNENVLVSIDVLDSHIRGDHRVKRLQRVRRLLRCCRLNLRLAAKDRYLRSRSIVGGEGGDLLDKAHIHHRLGSILSTHMLDDLLVLVVDLLRIEWALETKLHKHFKIQTKQILYIFAIKKSWLGETCSGNIVTIGEVADFTQTWSLVGGLFCWKVNNTS